MLGLFFVPDDGNGMFLRNVGSLSTVYTSLYSRGQNLSQPLIYIKDETFLDQWSYYHFLKDAASRSQLIIIL
jgi:hypothetical protein